MHGVKKTHSIHYYHDLYSYLDTDDRVQGVRLVNWVRELIIGIETFRDGGKPKYAINRTILDKNFHKQLILRYIGIERP